MGARNSPISVQLPDRPWRTLLISEAELDRKTERQSQRQREREQSQVPKQTLLVPLIPAQHCSFYKAVPQAEP